MAAIPAPYLSFRATAHNRTPGSPRRLQEVAKLRLSGDQRCKKRRRNDHALRRLSNVEVSSLVQGDGEEQPRAPTFSQPASIRLETALTFGMG